MWSLQLPNFREPLHITGVYCCPSNLDSSFPDAIRRQHTANTHELFETLRQHLLSQNHLHITAGDFNSHTGTQIETHITAGDALYFPTRKGDPYREPSQSTPSPSSLTTSPQSRGRLLLNLLNATQHIIANGRFEKPFDPSTPSTFISTQTNNGHTQTNRSIVDYSSQRHPGQHLTTVQSIADHTFFSVNPLTFQPPIPATMN